MKIDPLAGTVPEASRLVDIPKLLTAYYAQHPDPAVPQERVRFGTSGHRGSAFHRSFNEAHILATTQAICGYRKQAKIRGPLFLGKDTHALSEPAYASALEVLAANKVEVMIADNEEYTPTPALSHAILTYNHGKKSTLADGIVITPSHNPPEDGGFKYNSSNGGPADKEATSWIETKANEYLANGLRRVKRVSIEQALRSSTTHKHDYAGGYVSDLENVLDMDAIRGAGLKLGVDPMGGAGVHYWQRIAEHYRLDLTVVNAGVDPAFRFMTLDWDGKIRMDPSSAYAMRALVGLKDKFDVAFACDPDHDRHGIVTKSTGLLPPNHYLAVCVHHLFSNRTQWAPGTAIGKTLVSSSIIDRVAARLGKKLHEVPVGFKWFVKGLLEGWLGFCGEESAGATFLRKDGTVWTTDKDGMIAALLSAEITARSQRDPGELYRELTRELGDPVYERIDAPVKLEDKAALEKLSPEHLQISELAGERIEQILTTAPGDGAPIGGVKVIAEGGWFAARPSGTEEIYKIYAESFRGNDHLHRIQKEAQEIVRSAIAAARRTAA
ncbi:MAG TPA: phosphoglucomutase (alpha-D-glucose-1,6-bisphosphate-dependent) [Candidatus Angelobacter sp.]